MLKGKTVVLGVTGSIAAYKIASLASMLIKQHADVHVIMTQNATNFIHPTAFETLTRHKCLVDTFDRDFQFNVKHVSLAQQADVMMIAPASANVIGKLAHGIADDMLTTTAMACKAPMLIVPTMNTNMYKNPILQDNLKVLASYGKKIIEPASGMLACRDVGKGKMPEPEVLFQHILRVIAFEKDLAGKKVLVTAGPTQEAIDPVRYITNHSTGKMGFALAEACAEAGAEVMLVAGPVSLKTNHSSIDRIDVESAEEMYRAVLSEYDRSDIAIMCAAVADYAPETVSDVKLKRTGEDRILRLRPNPDIAAELGRRKRPGQCLVGFALETNDEEMNARLKMEKKNLDFIVLNSLRDAGAGFQCDTNKVTVIGKQGEPMEIPCKPKIEVAADIVDIIGRYVSEDR